MAVTARQQHADRTAHRVPDGNHRLDSKGFEQRRGVVGDVFQLEMDRETQATTMTSVVEREYGELSGKRFVCGEELEISTRRPSVQQEHDRGGWVGVSMEAVKQLAATRHHKRASLWQPRDDGIAGCIAHGTKP